MDPTSNSAEEKSDKHDLIVAQARALLETDIHFRGRAARFEFVFREDVLVVRGSVPTYYLKQVLQHVLKDLDGVRLIENQVTVSSGPGSV